nr:MAG TPA: hypothetical protein [Caudoviricetes sp.]
MKLELKVGQRFEAIDLEGETLEVVEGGLLKIVEPKKGKFVPKEGEVYWYIGLYGKTIDTIYDSDTDSWLVKHHPVFRTEDEAVEYKLYLEILDKYKYEFSKEEWENRDIEKWRLYYFIVSDELTKSRAYKFKLANCTYFKTQEDVESFIEEAGEENVKKFMFDVWE